VTVIDEPSDWLLVDEEVEVETEVDLELEVEVDTDVDVVVDVVEDVVWELLGASTVNADTTSIMTMTTPTIAAAVTR